MNGAEATGDTGPWTPCPRGTPIDQVDIYALLQNAGHPIHLNTHPQQVCFFSTVVSACLECPYLALTQTLSIQCWHRCRHTIFQKPSLASIVQITLNTDQRDTLADLCAVRLPVCHVAYGLCSHVAVFILCPHSVCVWCVELDL
jgi:hypothetical protein